MGLREQYFTYTFMFLFFGFIQCILGLTIGAIGSLVSSILMFSCTFTKSFRDYDR